jgi:BA14K-like protein
MSMLRIIVLAGLTVATSTTSFADKTDYCAAYARDFADSRTHDKPIWQHKYDIALAACLAEPQKAEIVKPVVIKKPVVKVQPAPIIPPEPAVAEVATAKPAKFKRPEPGTPEWNDYCTKKYTSFNAKTGTYLSHTGVERKCLVTAY